MSFPTQTPMFGVVPQPYYPSQVVVMRPQVTATVTTASPARTPTIEKAASKSISSIGKASSNQQKLDVADKPPVTTVFVGNISERAPDMLLSQMLSRCGNVLSWKRVQGASGKLQAFGFCEYEDPEATLRCIRLLNNWLIADKRLVVKVDPKTEALLNEYKRKKRGRKSGLKDGKDAKRRRKEEKEEGEEGEEKDEEKEEGEEGEEKEEGEEVDEDEEVLDDRTRGEDRLVKSSLDSLMREFSHDLAKANLPPHEEKPRKSEPEKRLEMMHRKRDRLEGPRHLTIEDMDLDSEKIDLINREIESFRNRHKDEDPQQEDEREREHRERRKREFLAERERAERERERIRANTAAGSKSSADVSGVSGGGIGSVSGSGGGGGGGGGTSTSARTITESSSRRSRRTRSRSISPPPPRSRSGRGGTSGGSSVPRQYEDDEEEEYERKRLERKLREKEMAYQERLKNWASRERKKQKEYEREREKEEERTAEENREARRLREFLEDYDDERDDPKFYKGANLIKRMKEREREREADERDARKEFEEMEAAKRRLLEDPNRDPNATELLITQMEANISGHLRRRLRMVDLENLPTVESVVGTETSAAAAPTAAATAASGAATATAAEVAPGGADSAERTGGSPRVRGPSETEREQRHDSPSDDAATPGLRSQSEDEASPHAAEGNGPTEEDRAGQEQASSNVRPPEDVAPPAAPSGDATSSGPGPAPSLLAPHELPPDADEQSGLSPAERKRQFVRRLIERIPTQKEELFAFVIDWTMVDEAFVERRIKPWINKKIVEYLGELEPSLSQFICQKVIGHSPPQEILNDIAMVLDEEAEVFVVKLWRLLIYVIEEKKAGFDQ